MKQSLNLDSLLKDYDGENTTEKIRNLKHSRKIRENVTKIVNLKKIFKIRKEKFTDNNGKSM